MGATYGKLRGEISAVRASLRQFDSKQTNSVVRFHIAVVDAYLSAVSQNHNDLMFFDGFALCVSDLLNLFAIQVAAAALRDAYSVKAP